ncbi:PEP-CTERM sorting domain-containing protein [Roseibacillus ishigakijimensis]|uniref:PEP-CTERM sorting domain-containing protein n=1 Tax=Roseibacillus ishigakijimensis TaxID=454146 RepID=A0A934RSC5_9BACT|nr:PEP-CTERM sorting domain-containing protein [Roseibacillus ishigakijimensis]MBK1834568.1 PEP-CTERM sorting domain-containing protein [Roseibacillus ishigakijimensis]
MKYPKAFLCCLSPVIILSASASAAIISINFDTGNVTSSTLGGAPGVRVNNWNVWAANTDLEEGGPVVDEAGTPVPGLTATVGVGGRSQRGNPSGLSNDSLIFTSVIDVQSSTTVSVSGVPYAQYDVYAYMHDDGSDRAGSFTIGGTTYYVRGTGSGNPAPDGTGYVLSTDTDVDLSNPNTVTVDESIAQGHYVVFRGVSGASFDLLAGAVDTSNGANRNKFSGFQIVQVPEPSSLALFLLSGGGFLLQRRRQG